MQKYAYGALAAAVLLIAFPLTAINLLWIVLQVGMTAAISLCTLFVAVSVSVSAWVMTVITGFVWVYITLVILAYILRRAAQAIAPAFVQRVLGEHA